MKNTYEAIKVDDMTCFNKHKIDHDNNCTKNNYSFITSQPYYTLLTLTYFNNAKVILSLNLNRVIEDREKFSICFERATLGYAFFEGAIFNNYFRE